VLNLSSENEKGICKCHSSNVLFFLTGNLNGMIEKIISGGQTGAERAALDVAIAYGISHGGWIPKGRKTETGRLPDKYKLRELSSINYPKKTELNVIDSEGTLILSHGKLTGMSALTAELATKHRKPCLHIDLNEITEYKAVEIIKSWIKTRGIKILNVAGPMASKEPHIYDATERVLKSVLYPPPEHITSQYPKTVDEAVNRLITKLAVKEKTKIVKFNEDNLFYLNQTLGKYIREHYGLLGEGSELMKSCRFIAKEPDLHEEGASALIIYKLWKKLKETHALRVVR